MTADTGYRLCWPVADAIVFPPGAVIEPCGRCHRPVLVDRLSTPDPPGTVLLLVCVRCALADPGMRGEVMKIWKATAALGDVLPPAFGRRVP